MNEIVLQTYDDQKQLSLRDIVMASSEYKCQLKVYSRGFPCDRPFYFSRSYLESFCKSLRTLDSSLVGEAELRHEYEDDIIRFVGLGHIAVYGTIADRRENSQQLDFSFTTDQTCLRKFATELESLL